MLVPRPALFASRIVTRTNIVVTTSPSSVNKVFIKYNIFILRHSVYFTTFDIKCVGAGPARAAPAPASAS